MRGSFKTPSVATVIATLALVITVGGGTAYAASTLAKNSVGSKQIRDGAVTYAKLSNAAKRSLRGNTGKTGATGKQGAPGKNGTNGTNGRDATGYMSVPVTTLSGTWVDHSGGGGTSSINTDGAVLGNTGTAGYAGISTDVLNGKSLADLSAITYTTRYTQTPDTHTVAPYFKFKLKPAGGACGDTDLVYNPTVQKDNLGYSGQMTTYNVTAPYSTTGVNNDANPVDGPYPVAIHSATNGAARDVTADPICLTEFILDGGSGANGATATVFDFSVAGYKIPATTYKFGS